jgi:hypothetical protein
MENEFHQPYREFNSKPSWISRNGSKLIAGAVVLGLLTLGGLRFRSTPIEMKGATYNGVRYEKSDGIEMIYFNRTPLVNRNRSFDGMKESIGDRFNVSGYKTFWGSYATQITPAAIIHKPNPHYGQTNANGAIDNRVLLPPEPYFD